MVAENAQTLSHFIAESRFTCAWSRIDFLLHLSTSLGAVNALSADISKSKNTTFNHKALTSLLPSKNTQSVIDVNKNDDTRRCAVVVFCFDDEIYRDMPLLN